MPKLGPLACSADWFLNGVSWCKENYKDTWKDAQQGWNTFGGVLERRLMVISKTDFSFWFTSWRLLVWRPWKWMYVTSHQPFWARRLSSMKFFLVTDKCVIKKEWDIEVNFDFVFLFEFYYHKSILKYVIPKNYIKIFGVFLATYLRFSEVVFTHFITKILRLLLNKKPPKNLGIETELLLQLFNESTVRLLDFLRTFNRTHSG